MVAIMTIVIVSILVLVLSFEYFRLRKRLRVAQNQKQQAEAEIKNLTQKELQLETALTAAENQFKQTLEDPITHLLGWKFFEDRLQLSFKEADRFQLIMGVMYVDIRDFKFINNVLSYEIGNALLEEVANRLQSCIRKVDSISRISKDVFVILLAQLVKPETAVVVAQRILQSLTTVYLVKDHELFINISIGIALFPADGRDMESLLKNAEQALAIAKQKGQNTYQFYQEEMHSKSQRALALYTHLNRDTILEELSICFQPIMNIQTNKMVCMEAMLCWQHPEFGEITANEIIEVATKQGKLNFFTEWLLRHAAQLFLQWQKQGLDCHLLAIPVTLQQLDNSHFIYRISQCLQELQFNPRELMFEINANALPTSFELLDKAFNMLSYLGINISINHFGETLFPLHYFKNLTIQFLKLDNEYINDVLINPQTQMLLSALLMFANKLSCQVVLHGDVDEKQMTALKQLGFTLIQSNFFGQPFTEHTMPAKILSLTE